jgi:hypothetical protein
MKKLKQPPHKNQNFELSSNHLEHFSFDDGIDKDK